MRPAFLKVTFDDADMHDLCRDAILEEARIEDALNEHARCTLRYRQTPDQRFPIENLIGKELAVIAVDSNGVEQAIFRGLAIEAELDFEMSGAYNLRIGGASRSLRMDLTPRHRSYPRAPIRSQLAKALELNGLELVDDARRSSALDTESGFLQIGESDFEFVVRIADSVACAVRPTVRGLQLLDHFVETDTTVEWRSEGGLMEFRLAGRMAPYEYHGWVYDRSESTSHFIDYQYDPPQFGVVEDLIGAATRASTQNRWQGELTGPSPASTEHGLEGTLQLEAWRAGVTRVFARGMSREASIRACASFQIQGPVEFAGQWGTLSVTHHWDSSGYWNEFTASPFSSPMSWRRPAWRQVAGLMVARVTKLGQGDKQGRVQIQFPWADGEPWIWVPFLSTNAGPNRGVYFSPEVGDEVLVAFELGDSRRPVIVGSAWNGVHPPPAAKLHGGEYGNNDIKRIVTKSGNRLVLDDKKGKETVVLATPHHVRVSLFDEGSKLLLHCDGDIHINAGGTVHMKCKQFLREIG
jgi:uncharacterized protein involved in type VI secretion and phage assembly